MTDAKTDAAEKTAANWEELRQRGERVSKLMQQRLEADGGFSVLDPSVVGGQLLEVAQRICADPKKMREAQQQLAEDYARLWRWTLAAMVGKSEPRVIEPAKDDRRFRHEAWTTQPVFGAIMQHYLLTARWLAQLVANAPGLSPHARRKAEFYVRQFLSATAPTNFATTNPQVLQAALDSDGETLRRGFENLLDDIERNRGRLRISLTNYDAFELGRNLATTPGKVIHQNDLAQVIQYAPTTDKVHRRPLMIVPPWINKYYVLDLQPKNSFIRWAVEQGHTVFLVSWINPDKAHAGHAFDDYLRLGPVATLDVIREATGEAEVNALGYCIGGTLLACALAHLAARDDKRVKSATFFTTMLDFADPGELGVFIDEEQVGILEKHLDERGYLEGAHMGQVFNLLRENDLIWSAYVNNYLLGKDPPRFDLLYWNADSTRMPAMMHKFYLREMYLNNRLIEPNALTIADTPIDLRRIACPTYLLSTREDHIAPWRSTFSATRLFAGPLRFVLAASGHIAGVINPPSANKYGYWTNTRRAKTPETFLKNAQRHEGSWWPDWAAWVARHGGGQRPARQPGEGALPAIEDAPGSYVRVRHPD